jgi:demethylmenaquinone methyltransferase/2-methoxy-6-polyprenyl-1,4-benzoquinol methylase
MLATLMQDRYWKRWLVDRASVERGESILDVGCGTGVLEEFLDGRGGFVVGLDLTEEMLRLAQEKRIGCFQSLSVGDAERLPFRDASFDLLVSCYVVKYCDSRRFASEMMRVLRPGGRLVLYDFTSPRGPFAPFHAFYVYGAMRMLGVLLKPADSGLAFTYEALPGVIQTRRWDGSFGAELEAVGFTEIGSKRLSGGVVTGFWATKP